jgi:hypothetical protein
MKSNSYLGAHVHWKVVKAFTVEAKRRGKPRRWSGLDIAGGGVHIVKLPDNVKPLGGDNGNLRTTMSASQRA